MNVFFSPFFGLFWFVAVRTDNDLETRFFSKNKIPRKESFVLLQMFRCSLIFLFFFFFFFLPSVSELSSTELNECLEALKVLIVSISLSPLENKTLVRDEIREVEGKQGGAVHKRKKRQKTKVKKKKKNKKPARGNKFPLKERDFLIVRFSFGFCLFFFFSF